MDPAESARYAALQTKLADDLHRRLHAAYPEGFVPDTVEDRRRVETIVEEAFEATGIPRAELEAAFDELEADRAAERLQRAFEAELEACAARGWVDLEALERLRIRVDIAK